MSRWMCRGCGHINQLEDGPVCENCLADNDHATEEILDAWERASRVTTSEALCRAEALRGLRYDLELEQLAGTWQAPALADEDELWPRTPPPTMGSRIQRLWEDSTPEDELWRDFRRTEAADAKAMPCPSCGAILAWEFLVSVDGFRCGACGYVIYGIEAAQWHARNDPPDKDP